MEFALFLQGYNPGFRREGTPDAEHQVFLDELRCAEAADKAGFKYVWLTEHHFLDEYSHLSANDAFAGYLASSTDRIHIGSGIFNPLPQVNHPAKVAERVAMLDHLSNGRFEFGTGRGAGSHEILGFLPDMEDLTGTREIWEDVIGEFPKMWMQDTYEGYEGKFWSLPPRKILPKPYVKPHPPMWYAAGNVQSWEMAGRKGLGILGFSVGELETFAPLAAQYRNAIANAEPVGAYANDNIMICLSAYVAEESQKARESWVNARPNYLVSNVFRYHDTFPHPPEIPAWPNLIPDYTIADADAVVAAGATIIGNPDEALAQCQRWADTGVDQIAFGIGAAATEETLEMIRLMGEYVIPKIDTDPEHSTSRYRAAAAS
jgi:alkanesulfonate monooxygenase SsuD/methylene tetrahydromethanopterin reductase-like flavin-dependent oxidoreductase (luciferase family)